eukprot:11789484-Karenia_brevis.AAC.1
MSTQDGGGEDVQDIVHVWSPPQHLNHEDLRSSVVAWKPGAIEVSWGGQGELSTIAPNTLLNLVAEMLAGCGSEEGVTMKDDSVGESQEQLRCLRIMAELGLAKCIAQCEDKSTW